MQSWCIYKRKVILTYHLNSINRIEKDIVSDLCCTEFAFSNHQKQAFLTVTTNASFRDYSCALH